MGRYTPWGDRAERMVEPQTAAYGCDLEELAALRAEGKRLLEERDSTAVMNEKVSKHFRNVRRTTSRRAARSLSMRLADVRSVVARLIDAGKLERDGTEWEESIGSGDRYAAAYKWVEQDERST
jgi:hypothetical protein